mgnify:CR=1 FL=1
MTLTEARALLAEIDSGWTHKWIAHDAGIIDETDGEDFGYYVRVRELGTGRAGIFDDLHGSQVRWDGSPAC